MISGTSNHSLLLRRPPGGRKQNATVCFSANSNIRSGILVGAAGYAAVDIDSLRFVFLKPKIKNTKISNMVFTEDAASFKPRTSSVSLDSVHYYAYPDVASQNNTFTFANSKSIKTTHKIEQHTLDTFGVHADIEVDASPIGIGVSASEGFQWTIEQGTLTSTEDSFDE